MADRKPTTAERIWLQRIAQGDITRIDHSWVSPMRSPCGKRSQSITTFNLSRYAWVDDSHVPGTECTFLVRLTEAGQAVIGPASPTPAQEGKPDLSRATGSDQ